MSVSSSDLNTDQASDDLHVNTLVDIGGSPDTDESYADADMDLSFECGSSPFLTEKEEAMSAAPLTIGDGDKDELLDYPPPPPLLSQPNVRPPLHPSAASVAAPSEKPPKSTGVLSTMLAIPSCYLSATSDAVSRSADYSKSMVDLWYKFIREEFRRMTIAVGSLLTNTQRALGSRD
jgi:hypothetical protein